MARKFGPPVRIMLKAKYGNGYAMIANAALRDKRFSTFTRLSNTAVVMGYDCEYAVFVHENLPNPPADKNYTNPKPNTGPKFLERAIREKRTEAREEYRRVVREFKAAGGPGFEPEAYMDPRARLAAANVIMNYSKEELVPVDTGKLQESAFVYVEGQSDYSAPESATKFVDYDVLHPEK